LRRCLSALLVALALLPAAQARAAASANVTPVAQLSEP